MKKIMAIAALVLGTAWAAPAAAQGFQWGVVGGLNLSKISVKGDYKSNLSSDNRTGWYFGPKVSFTLPLGLGFDGALEYSQRRLTMENPSGEASDTYRTLEIPINVRYNIGLGKLASVYVATGPQFGFGLGHMGWDNLLGSTEDGKPGAFSKSNMNTTWNVGAGLKLLGHLDVGVGYNFAIGKVGSTLIPSGWQGSSQDYELEYKTNTFQVQVAYMF